MDPDDGDDRKARGGRPNEASQAPWGIAFDLAFRLAISVVIGLGGGLALDAWLRTSPTFTLIGMVLGIGAAMYTIWVVARDAMRR